jgi:hypothetical protein
MAATTSELRGDNVADIPIVVVYDSNSTYATENGINYDKLTYELLLDENKEDRLTVSRNTPNGPVDRLLSDILGLLCLYGGTFILCDLYRTWKTGQWTSLAWMFLGPWNALTGAPLLHKITHLFDQVTDSGRAIDLCDTKYTEAKRSCEIFSAPINWIGIDDDDFDACMADAENKYLACYEATPEFKDCYAERDAYYETWHPGNTGNSTYAANDCLSGLGYNP